MLGHENRLCNSLKLQAKFLSFVALPAYDPWSRKNRGLIASAARRGIAVSYGMNTIACYGRFAIANFEIFCKSGKVG
jgi:hypothetical protein